MAATRRSAIFALEFCDPWPTAKAATHSREVCVPILTDVLPNCFVLLSFIGAGVSRRCALICQRMDRSARCLLVCDF
jgi:hypothetical protein